MEMTPMPDVIKALCSAAGRYNTKTPLIGLTGRRHVGKSTVAQMLCEDYGFARVHAFQGGKTAAWQYFEYVTDCPIMADEMLQGDLKDTPCPELPGGVAPRYFLEKFGAFMGLEMGFDWTLGMEIERARRVFPGKPIVVESLVYEAQQFRDMGGFIIRLEREGYDSPNVDSDAAQAAINVDEVVSSSNVEQLKRKVAMIVQQQMGGF